MTEGELNKMGDCVQKIHSNVSDSNDDKEESSLHTCQTDRYLSNANLG